MFIFRTVILWVVFKFVIPTCVKNRFSPLRFRYSVYLKVFIKFDTILFLANYSYKTHLDIEPHHLLDIQVYIYIGNELVNYNILHFQRTLMLLPDCHIRWYLQKGKQSNLSFSVICLFVIHAGLVNSQVLKNS